MREPYPCVRSGVLEQGDTAVAGKPRQPDSAGPPVETQLSGCVPSSLLGRLDMEYSDLGGFQFCPGGPGSPGLSPR